MDVTFPRLDAACAKMTQFSHSSTNNNVSKSHRNTTKIFSANKMKTSHGLSSRILHGNTAANVKIQLPVSYMLCGHAVRNSPVTLKSTADSNGPFGDVLNPAEQDCKGRKSLLHMRSRRMDIGSRQLMIVVNKCDVNSKPPESSKYDVNFHTSPSVPAVRTKALSVPSAVRNKPQPFRTSLSSPPSKQRRVLSRLRLPQDCRAKRTLTYTQSDHIPVESADPSLADEANKENWDNSAEVDIHKILQTLDRDMGSEADGRSLEDQLPGSVCDVGTEDYQQICSVPAIVMTPVSKMETEELTPERQEVLPQDIGFPNPPGSNLCWMNATLQTLLGMQPFMEELERFCWLEDRKGQSALLQSFFEVVKHRRRGRRLSLHSALRHLSRSLGALDVMFMSDRQQDATEFLVRLLDSFREQFGSSKSDCSPEERKMKESCMLRELQLDNLPTNGSAVQRFKGGEGQADDSVRNPVCDNVEFCLKETYCCTSCSEISNRCQDHLALFLDIPPMSQARPSLQEALSRYMQPDVRELKCDRCDGQRSKVETAFTKLPRFLLVQVKRYAVQTAVAEKVTSSLRVPISLSVKNYVMDDVVMPAPWLPHSSKDSDPLQFSLDDDDDKELQEAMRQSLDDSGKEIDLEALELEKAIRLSLQEQGLTQEKECSSQLGDADVPVSELEGEDESPDHSYRLVCVIMHQGISPNCGHYVADVYNLEQHQWYHYDDEVVSHPTEDEVVGSARQRNGYVFCYMHRQLFDQLTKNTDKS
ncbi:ubiquitin carboxyl-terminal hydrolase 37-like isoform X2 [Zootermopsis nevadensis]|uniref:Ubiquitin carboxyl-terminal hydrolase 37 n=1 Tax=Zootermopsis nevadensis TaxID=136037 RepID=A0A067RI19_ZOONE|nr:ubiquitin carboxyl-terminal hydrolase 37-like isoform X2 [Zootermopsis nevadensis]KDR18892.1 Ubiquitin carboxyl-terminal hydrolase 37 [Zootermopsis nevadensis]